MVNIEGLLENDTAIQIDLFPASVVIDGKNSGEDNRVILTDKNLYIFKESPLGAYIFFTTPATREQFDRPSLTQYTVITDEHSVSFKRAKHCGCGSRLRGIQPFRGLPYWQSIKVNK